MKITKINTLHCDAGWRPWTFIKIETDEGIVGWSECTDSHGSPRAIEGAVRDLGELLIGTDPRQIEKHRSLLYARTRQNPGGIIAKAIGGIENTLLDIKAKALNVPVYELSGGPVREKIPLYWSHAATSRVRAAHLVGKKQIKTKADIKHFAEEVRKSGFKVIKTNIAILGGEPFIYMPGFAKSHGGPELNADRKILSGIESWIDSLRNALPEEIDIILDLNFNFKTEGYIQIGRMLEKYRLLWLEIDSYDPRALRQIKDSVAIPVASCENLYGARQFLPFFEQRSMDIASIDIIWNGFSESKRIAELANLYEMNVTAHNYNGYLSTFISAHLFTLIPNIRIMEVDVDDVPWREELFTNFPAIKNGELTVPTAPGWGTDVNEAVLEKHPWPKK